ncbi:hypothetical protein CERSUDRAFT_145753 [Gelatoporia subvermispora B]|uniref:DDE-1 domain-containing protein n=1 Tax=Ceriporiopsis subvermispora (strain B) TaxID=914234 RepID=M2P6L6_CERS8|nr:hypothetical protein CERSUDRAFT_145753 [Gelatoporia subvermispora B]
MRWSIRQGTRAGQKVPQNAEEVMWRTWLRLAAIIRDENVPCPCIVNSDQTQMVYSPGDMVTYEELGAKQVDVVGSEEKRAFTLLVGVSASGEVLPFQAIYAGILPKRSLPKPSAPFYDELLGLGCFLEVSRTATYWSTLDTMKKYVEDILSPYLRRQLELLNLPADQACIWIIDVWSVHRSIEFRVWVKDHYHRIILVFVPGGCTGLFQPCDVGIQRILKHAMRRSGHLHMVNETLAQLNQGVDPEKVMLDKSIGVIRDRSVEWMYHGYNAINKPEIVLKAWEMCKVKSFSLSYESLTSREARQELNRLALSDPEFYAEITGREVINDIAGPHPEDIILQVGDFEAGTDDSSLSLRTVISKVATEPSNPIPDLAAPPPAPEISDGFSDEDPDIPAATPSREADDTTGREMSAEEPAHVEPETLGRGQRARRSSRRYDPSVWCRYDAGSDEE